MSLSTSDQEKTEGPRRREGPIRLRTELWLRSLAPEAHFTATPSGWVAWFGPEAWSHGGELAVKSCSCKLMRCGLHDNRGHGGVFARRVLPSMGGRAFISFGHADLQASCTQALRSAYSRMQIALRLRAPIAKLFDLACLRWAGHELGRRPLGAVDTRSQLPGMGGAPLRNLQIYMPDTPGRACLRPS